MFVLVLGRSRSRLTPVPITKVVERKVSGGYGGGDIPVPIPNTAVKPTSADGTWGFPPGRVGRRRDFLKDPHRKVGVFRISRSCSRRAAGLERSHRQRQLESIRSVTDDAYPDVGRRGGDDVGVRLASGVGLNAVH
jgi:hypothetical protein